MKTLALLSLSLAVVLAVPPFAPGVLQNPVLNEEYQSPMQGHVVVDDPVPQVKLGSEEQQKELAPVPVDMELSQNLVELEVKVKPEIGVEHEGEVKTEVKKENEAEPQLKPEPDVKEESEVKDEQEGKDNQEVKVEQELIEEAEVRPEPDAKVNVNSDNEMGHELKDNTEAKVETEVKMGVVTHVEPEVKLTPEVMAELDINEKPEVEMEPEPEGYPDFKVESEVKVDKNVLEHEMKLMFKRQKEVEEKFQVQMNLEAETEAGQEFNEKHIDRMELEPLDDDNMFADELTNIEVENSLSKALEEEGLMSASYGEPIMELEPLDDDYLFADELTNIEVENSLSKAPEEEGLMRVSQEEPIMELEPEMKEENDMPDAVIMDEGPALDIMGQPITSVEEYFPNEEARIRMEPVEQSDLMVEAMSQFVQEEELSPMVGMQRFEVPAREATGRCCCPGVLLEGKCYQFFKRPLKAADAEFFCQEHFMGGHLASITSQRNHRELMNMMLNENGAYTRTWIGGLRYLETGRFIWLDGSHWSYADWLSGEPNNTSDLEDCIEVLALGNGKFNDFTCWEPQAFICSYPYQ